MNRTNVGAVVNIDEWPRCDGVGDEYTPRETVNHLEQQRVLGDVHTNSIGGIWALVKRSIVGMFLQMSEKHLGRPSKKWNGGPETDATTTSSWTHRAASSARATSPARSWRDAMMIDDRDVNVRVYRHFSSNSPTTLKPSLAMRGPRASPIMPDQARSPRDRRVREHRHGGWLCRRSPSARTEIDSVK